MWCQTSHVALFHFKIWFELTSSSPSPKSETTNPAKTEPSIVSMASTSHSNTVVLLTTVQAEMSDVKGDFMPVRILLDSASQSSFITEDCVQRSGLSRSPCKMLVLGLSDSKAASEIVLR